MAPRGANNPPKGTGDVIGDLWQLIRDYAKQETVDPLRSLGRFLGYGLLGAVLLSLGLVFGVLAVLRVLQDETGEHLTGSWNFVPYAVTLVVAAVIGLICRRSITKPNRVEDR